MFFWIDTDGDKGDGIKDIAAACTECGIGAPGAITAQSQFGYCFEFHTGAHGDPVVYVNHASSKARIGKNVPSIYLSNPPSWQRGSENFKSKDARDALQAVTNNRALLTQMYTGFYG